MEYEKALALYKEILEIDPKSVEAYLGMAEVYVAMGEYEEALKVLEEGYEETGSSKIEKKIEEVEALINGGKETTDHSQEPTVESLQDNSVIDWIDPNLEAKMRDVTGIYDRDIVCSDVKEITELNLSIEWESEEADKIRNISALVYLPNLEHLSLDSHAISDISALGNLTNLKGLSLCI